MILFPAIDLKQGQCVRLEKGDMNKATLFNPNPLAQLDVFKQQGFDWLHLIDLDGATESGDNKKVIETILAQKKMKTQIGGGIRSLKQIDAWLEKGAERIILGTLALTQPEIAKEACARYPKKIIIALDGVEGFVALQGWKKISDEKIIDVAHRIQDWGAAAILFTDIARDGLKKGINIEATLALSEEVDMPIIASGGLKGMGDIKMLTEKNIHKKIEGVITGRALYENAFNATTALTWIKQNA